MKTRKSIFLSGVRLLGVLGCVAGCLFAQPVHAQRERDEDAAKLAATGHSPDVEVEAPRKLVDLTKGERIPPPRKGDNPTWLMGPTGIIGIKNGGNKGDQIRVISVAEGGPANGKVLPGDVLLGVQGKTFDVGGDINWLAGNAIIDAETEAGKGILTVQLWRDRNWIKRTGAKDVFGVDIDKMFKEAEAGGADIYEWENEQEKTASVKQMGLDKFPIDGVYTNVALQLEVMGTYSDDSPWNCPVVQKVRDNALKIIAARVGKKTRRGRMGGDWPDILALVASGKPEYVAQAKDWVHSLPQGGKRGLCMDMEYEPTIDDVTYRGMQSWHHGFGYLEMAIYYDATRDEFILPEIRRRAIVAALGQNGGGSWGHTFAFPEFNGGELHRNNPGYGAMNNAGGRCFFLLALAKKAGIDEPEINVAIERATRFFGTYIDKGCIPYGYHSPWPSDDSNGKNYGPAYAFYTLGNKYAAKYFSMHSAHASFTRRGGHASPTLWYYTPLSAHMAGPDAVKAYMRNMRPFYTLSRRYDGSFIFQGEQQPGIGGKGMRNATATVALHMSAPLHQLMITGKDADTNFWMTPEEMDELLVSARGQIKDPVLLERVGKLLNERGTDELLDYLDHFFPKKRQGIATELGKRYANGEKDILPKAVQLLGNDEPRMRDGAALTISACGEDAVLANMSKVVSLLKDDAEFVRMTAAKTIGRATKPGDTKRELALLWAASTKYDGMTMDNGNLRNAVKGILFARKRRGQPEGPTSLLISTPFATGYDEQLLRSALESIVTMDPQGAVPGTWDRTALLKLAGPVTFSAEELQVNDAMFGGARKQQAQALLRKHGYREYVDGVCANLRKRSLLDRSLRRGVTFKDANITPKMVKQEPGLYRSYLKDLYLWQQDDPTLVISEKTGKGLPPITTPVNLLIEIIEKDADRALLPTIGPDVAKMFQTELAKAGGTDEQLKLCRRELADLDRKNSFRKICAMDQLAKLLGPKAIDEISPFLGHEYWRLRDHARELTVSFVQQGAGDRVLELYQEAQSREGGLLGNLNAAGILEALADAQYKPSLAVAKAALKHDDPVVRSAAIQSVFKLGGSAELKTVFAFLRTVASEREDFHGAEIALLSEKDDPQHVERVSKAAITLLPQSEPPLRRSLAWVLGQFGGEKNLAAIEQAATTTENNKDLNEMVLALAYSPDRSADRNMMALIKAGKAQRDMVASLGVHRMVGPNGMGDVEDEDRVRFARQILNLKYNNKLISFLGRVHTASSMQLMYDVMKNGRDSTGVAVESIISCAEGMGKLSKAQSALASEVLADVVEYIEVTHLRGGAKAHVKVHTDAPIYAKWQGMQRRAGQALLKFEKPKSSAIPTFDDMDLDI